MDAALAKRLLSAAVGLAILIPLLRMGGWPLRIFVSVAGGITLYEFLRLSAPGKEILGRHAMWIASLGTLTLLGLKFWNRFPLALSWGVFALLAAASLRSFSGKNDKFTAAAGHAVLGFIYVTFPCYLFLNLSDHPAYGSPWLFLILAGTFLGDTGAYFVGHACGRHKLCPAVSPGKTWEGFVGQVLSAVLGAIAWRTFLMPEVASVQEAALVGLLCGLFGPLGDLTESMLKRAAGVKDSGAIMPGHGGLLDRIDGVLFAIPPVFYYLIYFR